MAMESLIGLADELKAARAALIAALPQAMGREVEGYVARTVDATADLKEAVFMGAARQLLKVGVLGTCICSLIQHFARSAACTVDPTCSPTLRHELCCEFAGNVVWLPCVSQASRSTVLLIEPTVVFAYTL